MQLTCRRKSSVSCGLKSKRKNKTVQRLSGLILGGKFNVLYRILLFVLFPFLCKDGKNPRSHRCSIAHMEIRGLEGSAHRAWWKASLFTEPSCAPRWFFIVALRQSLPV